jgi:hypothetical protein
MIMTGQHSKTSNNMTLVHHHGMRNATHIWQRACFWLCSETYAQPAKAYYRQSPSLHAQLVLDAELIHAVAIAGTAQ